MISTKIDMTGKQCGRLTVLGYSHTGADRKAFWNCRCACGKLTTVVGKHLRSGNTRSCGCLQVETITALRTTHGRSTGRAYGAWYNALRRCTDPSHRQYSGYGGRGITFAKRWMKFENFFADMGEPGHKMTLDRIDNDRGYHAKNCRWASYQTQLLNRRNTVFVDTPNGRLTVVEAAKMSGLSYDCLLYRVRQGYSPERIFSPSARTTTPPTWAPGLPVATEAEIITRYKK